MKRLKKNSKSLAEAAPEVAKQWYQPFNGHFTPDDVASGSGVKFWWKCDVADDHVWDASTNNRTNHGSGCPHCTLTPRSAHEIRLAYELSSIVNFDLEKHKIRFQGKLLDIDIVLDQLRVIVEFDGAYWHRNKIDKDREKTALIEKSEWQVIRVRERPLESIHINDVMVETNAAVKFVADRVLTKIVEVTGIDLPRLDQYLESDEPWREADALTAIRGYLVERAGKEDERES